MLLLEIAKIKLNPLAKHFLEQPGLLTVTDRAKGLIKALEDSIPTSYARHCALHLLGNLPGEKIKGNGIK